MYRIHAILMLIWSQFLSASVRIGLNYIVAHDHFISLISIYFYWMNDQFNPLKRQTRYKFKHWFLLKIITLPKSRINSFSSVFLYERKRLLVNCSSHDSFVLFKFASEPSEIFIVHCLSARIASSDLPLKSINKYVKYSI